MPKFGLCTLLSLSISLSRYISSWRLRYGLDETIFDFRVWILIELFKFSCFLFGSSPSTACETLWCFYPKLEGFSSNLGVWNFLWLVSWFLRRAMVLFCEKGEAVTCTYFVLSAEEPKSLNLLRRCVSDGCHRLSVLFVFRLFLSLPSWTIIGNLLSVR